MSKIQFIANSVSLRHLLIKVAGNPIHNGYTRIIRDGGRIYFSGTKHWIDAESKGDSSTVIYFSTIRKLAEFLNKLSDQPVNLIIEDSETFNCKIVEAYL